MVLFQMLEGALAEGKVTQSPSICCNRSILSIEGDGHSILQINCLFSRRHRLSC